MAGPREILLWLEICCPGRVPGIPLAVATPVRVAISGPDPQEKGRYEVVIPWRSCDISNWHRMALCWGRYSVHPAQDELVSFEPFLANSELLRTDRLLPVSQYIRVRVS